MPSPFRIHILMTLGLLVAFAGAARAGFVAFEFRPLEDRGDPYARRIWGEVKTPSGASLRLPAFVSGEQTWTVRARADAAGRFSLVGVSETTNDATRAIPYKPVSPAHAVVAHAAARPQVGRAPDDPTRFSFPDGTPYIPLGANLAWQPGGIRDQPRGLWHAEAFRQFAAQGLNWTRVWMCHWGGTNLDWLPDDLGPSPAPGRLDPRVAATWDHILTAAEEHGIYVQVVLQHHGQYTTGANANWAINPWNAAHPGGFLRQPGDFFTSPRAIALTRQKYRYIVARWGWSPAVLAWELFNEVHWTNGYMDDEPAVARWHADMAAYIRSIDTYGHLITTSLDDVRSPIYAAMDYYQPHLYAMDMLAGVRRFERPFDEFDRPVFYGEIGDDKMPVTAQDKSAGVQLTPQVWAGLMSPGPLPGQSWLGELYLATDRLAELGAIARFLQATRLATRDGLRPFSPAMEGNVRVPFLIEPGHEWHRHVPARVRIPLDGSVPAALADIPAVLVGARRSLDLGFPGSISIELELPRETAATLHFSDAGVRGAVAEVFLDKKSVAVHRWPREPGAPRDGPQPPDTPRRPASVSFTIPAGPRTLSVRNTGGADWVRLGALDLGFDVPTIAAAGKRGDDFVALWIWHRTGVHAVTPPAAAEGTILLDDVPAGTWVVTWWDTDTGQPGAPVAIEHPGGLLRLATPPISRHAAVVLARH